MTRHAVLQTLQANTPLGSASRYVGVRSHLQAGKFQVLGGDTVGQESLMGSTGIEHHRSILVQSHSEPKCPLKLKEEERFPWGRFAALQLEVSVQEYSTSR